MAGDRDGLGYHQLYDSTGSGCTGLCQQDNHLPTEVLTGQWGECLHDVPKVPSTKNTTDQILGCRISLATQNLFSEVLLSQLVAFS